jgi:hypothetical protein
VSNDPFTRHYDRLNPSSGTNATGGVILNGALARPLILKSLADPAPLLRAEEVSLARQASACGLILKLKHNEPWQQRILDRGVILFPHFSAGAPLSLRALTPGEACFRLLDNCLNVRNLPAAALASLALLPDACRPSRSSTATQRSFFELSMSSRARFWQRSPAPMT